MRNLWLCLLLAPLPAIAQEFALMPWPAQVEHRTGQLTFSAPLQPRVDGPASERTTRGLERWSMRLAEKAGPAAMGDSRNGMPVLIRYERVADLRTPDVDGSYALAIDSTGITVQAPTDIGVLHALATLYQCFRRDDAGWGFPSLRITDDPRFTWRGLLIDPCRHFMPLDVILRQLDGMELVKMNVLHLHLTEDQGFRIESKLLPELHEKGSNGQYLSQEDIRKIIREADLRGIRVVPEFDLPGHATSWFASHPELASAPGTYQPDTRYGVLDAVFDPTNEATYALLDRFLGEMAALFPDPYLHIGGDENNGKQWDANPAIQAFMKAHNLPDNHALQAYFNQRLYAILKKHGKRMMGWDEIGDVPAGSAPALPQDVTIQSWRGKEGLVSAAHAGRNAILSNGWYIDLCQSAEFHYLNDPLPPDSPLNAEERKHVLGGEATMWAELVDARNVDTRIWPRAAAVAERLWSPASVKDVPDMYRRMEAVSKQLDAIGLRHKSAQLELLRLMAGSDDVAGLKGLVDVMAPVQGYKRHQLAVHTTHTPLTGLADAAVPDPEGARRSTALIDAFIARRDAATAAALRPALEASTQAPALPCCRAAANARNSLVQPALAAMDSLLKGTAPDAGACKTFQLALDRAQSPILEAEFADLPAFQRLFAAACTPAK
ncbi:MAG TPA: family 20 glycosylhydrolase [Flavobacteriales bacterium]|nr:family 20 glycosylhydrolase [Flavobacteriales bacterium]